MRLWSYFSNKIKHIPKRKRLVFAIFAGVIIVVLAIVIWALVTGKLRPLAGVIGQISNTATVTYQDSTGATQTINSNTVVVDLVVNSPTAPSGLTATATSSSQINLTWTDNSSDETGFKIERATPNCTSTFSVITTTSANATSYSNTGLTASTTYCYQVKATNAGGDSAASNQASATTQGTPPAAPSNLSATATSSSQINLTWVDNSNNETGFKLERATPNCTSTFSQIATPGVNAASYQNTGLTANTTYCYRIRATNASGDSGYSNTSSATTPSASVTVNLSITLQGRTDHSTTGTALNVYTVGTTTNPVFTKTDIVTDTAGHASFALPLTSGNYDFRVKPSYFLTQKLANIAIVNPLALTFSSSFRGGDLNNDDIVNSVDFARLSGYWGQSDPVADINKDGTVNTIDFSILNSNWFVQGQ